MRRTFLIILAAAGGLVALLFLAVAIAIWRVDPNDLAAPIQARIKEVTGRDATIRGSIDLKVSLTPRLVVRDLALANAPWGQTPSMVAAKQLDVEFALLPLLTRRFEVIRVELVEPAIALDRERRREARLPAQRVAKRLRHRVTLRSRQPSASATSQLPAACSPIATGNPVPRPRSGSIRSRCRRATRNRLCRPNFAASSTIWPWR
jgi:uncharacterized protein involved in outer membrane biogenesis